MRALLIKTSSFGDVIHTFPAISDALTALPDLRLDWVVEPAFADIAALHPGVARIIPVSMRALRSPTPDRLRAWLSGVRVMRGDAYDAVIDAQGLLKTLPLTLLARGTSHGFDQSSARESWAALAYRQRHHVARQQHAIERTRALLAAALGYMLPLSAPVFGIAAGGSLAPARHREVVLVPATSWSSKLWALASWRELAALLAAQDYHVIVPAHGEAERGRAEHIVAAIPNTEILPPMALAELARRIAGAAGMVASDTGLAHLGAALGVPTLTLYGPTAPGLTGTIGRRAVNLAATSETCVHLPCLDRQCRRVGASASSPCLSTITPANVASRLARLMAPD